MFPFLHRQPASGSRPGKKSDLIGSGIRVECKNHFNKDGQIIVKDSWILKLYQETGLEVPILSLGSGRGEPTWFILSIADALAMTMTYNIEMIPIIWKSNSRPWHRSVTFDDSIKKDGDVNEVVLYSIKWEEMELGMFHVSDFQEILLNYVE